MSKRRKKRGRGREEGKEEDNILSYKILKCINRFVLEFQNSRKIISEAISPDFTRIVPILGNFMPPPPRAPMP